jgi:hypothetical protein
MIHWFNCIYIIIACSAMPNCSASFFRRKADTYTMPPTTSIDNSSAKTVRGNRPRAQAYDDLEDLLDRYDRLARNSRASGDKAEVRRAPERSSSNESAPDVS